MLFLLLIKERFSGVHFAEFACQGSQCSSEHVQYIKSKGGKLLWLKELRVFKI
jgi:formiminoglutamase